MSETGTDRTTISIERVEKPATLAGRYQLSFHMDERHAVSVHLTQGELLSLWQEIGAYFNLAGMGDAKAGREPLPVKHHPGPHSEPVTIDARDNRGRG